MDESTTRRKMVIDSTSKDKIVDTYNPAIIGLSEYIKQGKNTLIRLVQEYHSTTVTK